MKRFEKSIRIGTLVKIAGLEEWQIVEAFDAERRLVKLKGIEGMSQRAHVMKYSNKYNKR